MAQYVVRRGDTLWDIAQRVLGSGSRWRELGYTGDPRQLRAGITLNYGGGGGGQQQAQGQPAQAQGTEDPYQKLIREWYSVKPATPSAFEFTPEAEQAARKTVGQEYRPFYQEKIDISKQQFADVLQQARQGYSRRGLWGAAPSGTPVTAQAGAAQTAPTGPVSGIRQQGEQRIGEEAQRAETGFERAYREAVEGGVLQRGAEARDVYQKTMRDPYETA